MNSLTDLKALQTEASELSERLNAMSDTETGRVRQQVKGLADKAFDRYMRRRDLVSQAVNSVWGAA